MPTSTRLSRKSFSGGSPPRSVAHSVSHATTVLGQQRLNIVTRLAIEGRAERGANGASIKVYLKISLPLDSVTPGATIPLFPEENLKVLDSQVHPLDANSNPYNFSSAASPLLHKAARALNLPARSPQSYVPLTGSSSTEPESPLDERYTGQILVSSYHVSYILPKEFPRRETDPRSKRPSTFAQFMAAIDIWAPFISQPPHAPYLLSIPVPRCLSNHIRLKIFSPNKPKTSSSLASLSSADEGGSSWDLASDPHVTRSASARLSRSSSYNNFADDESSDASTSAGFADGCGIQGSFPSTDRIRIRWAKPIKASQLPQTSDGRRRVGIKEVKGDMTCTVLGASPSQSKSRGGIVLRVQYEATCKGVWFPGVATLLGLDVNLDAGDCDVSWVPGTESKWFISGGVGFTGYAVGPPATSSVSRQSSAENPSIYVLPSSPDARGVINGLPAPRHDSSSSTSSLLRAPLPVQSVPDYSFESSPASTPVSSLASLPLISSPEGGRRSRAGSMNGHHTDFDTDYDEEEEARPPKVPITIHVNMNDLQPPSKHDFKFSISGTVLVKPRQPVLTSSRRYNASPNVSQPGSDTESDQDVLTLPRFRTLYADREHISCTVRNDVNDSMLDVYNSTGDVRDAQTRKTVLQRGGQIKCGTDGARLALRPIKQSLSPPARGGDRDRDRADSVDASRMSIARASRSRLRNPDPNGVSERQLSPTALRQSFFASTLRTPVRRDGPLMIPYVAATITPLLGAAPASRAAPKYAVRVNLPAPTDEHVEWLEFGLALPRPEGDNTVEGAKQPKVEVASASIEGVPVRVSTRAVVKPEATNGNSVPFGEASGKEWITWVKVHVGDAGGGKVDILYLVSPGEPVVSEKEEEKSRQPASGSVVLNAMLPSFSLPVGELEVNVPVQTGFHVISSETNLAHEQLSAQGRKLSHYSMDDYFYPRLVLTFAPTALEITHVQQRAPWSWPQLLITVLLTAISLFFFINLRQTQAQLSDALRSMHMPDTDPAAADIPHAAFYESIETITITATTTVIVSSPTSATQQYQATAGSSSENVKHAPPPAQVVVPDEAVNPPPLRPSDASTTANAARQIPTITPTPMAASQDSKGRSLARLFPLPFSIKVEFPSINFSDFRVPKDVDETLRTVLDSLDVVYQLFRKVYHYPLDPP